MADFRFLASGTISLADLERVAQLTEAGSLRWVGNLEWAAYDAYPITQEAKDDRNASREVIGDNLRGIKVGWNPHKGDVFHYLRLTGHDGERHYIEEGSSDELMAAADRVYQLARRAVRLGGTLTAGPAATEAFCARCGHETEHKRLYDAPYGLAGAIMADSNRLVCVVCENAVFV